jgi:hypothetical protein
MYSVLNRHNVAQRFNVTSTGNAGCLKNNFTMVFQMLLCDECYENVYTIKSSFLKHPV